VIVRKGDRVKNIVAADETLELTVIRVARDGTWVDVRVRQPHTGAAWSKRLPRFILRRLEAASRPCARREGVQEAAGEPFLRSPKHSRPPRGRKEGKMKRPTIVHGLSVSWPWAVPIVTSYKRFEVRHWEPRVGLPCLVAIHQAKSIDSNAPLHVQAKSNGRPWPGENGIVGVATLVEVIRFTAQTWESLFPFHWDEGDFEDGLLGWKFSNPLKCRDPIPCKGNRGLWRVPPEVIAAVYGEEGVPQT